MTHDNSRRWFGTAVVRSAVRGAIVLGLIVVASLTLRSGAWTKGTLHTMMLSAVLSAQTPAASYGSASAVDPQIAKAAEDYRKAVLSGDARAVAAMYREDGIELPNCAPAVKGRAAIEQRYREFFGGPVKVTGFTFTHIEAVTTGDLAYDVGTYEQTLSLPGGQATTDHGKFVALVKRAQGTWKLAYLIYNSDTDPAKTR